MYEKAMDFSKFLHSGELSDIAVVVDSKIYRLHKFPLCIKSDFFRTLARSNLAEKDSVTLTDFPGGSDTFRQVVDYFYNVHIDIDASNVCQLRCAAEFLQMTSPGNLSGVTDRFLQETLTSVRAGRKLETVLEMLRHCRSLGAIAEQAGIVERCLGAIVDTWLSTPVFSRHLSTSKNPNVDIELLLQLCTLPLNWFSELLRLAKEKFVAGTVRGSLIQLYISKALDIGNDREKKKREGKKEEERKSEEEIRRSTAEDGNIREKIPKNNHEIKDKENVEEKEDEDKNEEDEDEDKEEEDKEEEEEEEEEGNGGKMDEEERNVNHDREDEIRIEGSEGRTSPKQLSSSGRDEDDEEEEPEESEENRGKSTMDDDELATILDTLLHDNAEDTLSLGYLVSPKWILTVLDKAVALGCKAQDLLVQLAARCLNRFSPDDLQQIRPDTYVMILQESCKDTGAAEGPIAPDEICQSVDSFLQCLSNRGTLTSDIFRQILETLPEKYRTNEDTLFHVLEKLLKSDESDLSDDERQSLLESIDFGRLSEVALNAAFNSRLVPVEHITKAALLLSSRLRAELDAANSVIQMQQEELNGLRDGWRKSYSTESQGPMEFGTDFSRESFATTNRYRSTPRSKSYGTGTGSAYYIGDSGSYYRTVPSLASDLELQLALSSLGGDVTHDPLHYNGRQTLHPFGYHNPRFPDPPAYDDTDYFRPSYRPLPSGQTYSGHKRYFAKHHR